MYAIVDIAVNLKTPRDVGALIRAERRRQGLDQKTLADQVGVSRQWLLEAERGKARAALGLVLRTLNALGVRLEANVGKSGQGVGAVDYPRYASDIDAIVDKARRRKP